MAGFIPIYAASATVFAVIVLLPPGVAEFAPQLGAESPVQLGQALAKLR